MKLDPGIHIVMHSVLSLKLGVTRWRGPAMTSADKIRRQQALDGSGGPRAPGGGGRWQRMGLEGA
jgi:hypothetical protein